MGSCKQFILVMTITIITVFTFSYAAKLCSSDISQNEIPHDHYQLNNWISYYNQFDYQLLFDQKWDKGVAMLEGSICGSKFIFSHIYKIAGTTIQDGIEKLVQDGIIDCGEFLKCQTWDKQNKTNCKSSILNTKINDETIIFTFVRDPLERFLSAVYEVTKRIITEDGWHREHHLKKLKVTFEQYRRMEPIEILRLWIETHPRLPHLIYDPHFQSILFFLRPSNEYALNFTWIGNLLNFDHDLFHILKKFIKNDDLKNNKTLLMEEYFGNRKRSINFLGTNMLGKYHLKISDLSDFDIQNICDIYWPDYVVFDQFPKPAACNNSPLWHQFWRNLKNKAIISSSNNKDISIKEINTKFCKKTIDPFKYGWRFGDYKAFNNLSYPSLNKLDVCHLTIDHVEQANGQNIACFNPSIIEIKPYHKQFMLKNIHSSTNIEIINQSSYLMVCRFHDNQCTGAGAQSQLNVSTGDVNDVGVSIILLDINWNTLMYVKLDLYDDDVAYSIRNLEDCRLFDYLSMVYMYCMSYYMKVMGLGSGDGYGKGYIGAVLWKEENCKLMAYLDIRSSSSTPTQWKVKQIYHDHIASKLVIGSLAKNLVPLLHNDRILFLWDLEYTYFIECDPQHEYYDGKMHCSYAYSNPDTFLSSAESISISQAEYDAGKYHLSAGFIYLKQSSEYLGIGHTHFNLYDNGTLSKKVFNIKYGTHYAHFVFTIDADPPHHITRISDKFCFRSQSNDIYKETDCDVLQFVGGVISKTIDNIEYLFISYGINDCIGGVAKIKMKKMINMLKPVNSRSISID